MARDIKAVRLISKIIPIESKSIAQIKTVLGKNTGSDEEDLGFGARRFNLSKGNGYTSLYVDAFTWNGTDLIENVLRGYNPGGRVYAALAMLKMQREGVELSAKAQGALNKVVELPVRVTTCSGCIVNSGLTAKDIIRIYIKATGDQ